MLIILEWVAELFVDHYSLFYNNCHTHSRHSVLSHQRLQILNDGNMSDVVLL